MTLFSVATLAVAALGACGGGGGDAGAATPDSSASADQASAPATSLPAPRRSARVFVSGHSLTDNPMSDDLIEIANSVGGSSQYNQQIVLGSPLRVRTRGNDSNSSGWSGYRQGKNREGQGMNVLSEIARPQAVSGPYDVLLFTERHDLISVLMFEDTLRYARHFHDRLVAAQPNATSYFYQSWQSLRDKSAPAGWVAYERAASPVWTCMATRINQSLAAEGSGNRVVPLPAGAALAELIDRATQGKVEGITRGSVRETVDSLIQDDVHPTRLGAYYMALVSYSAIYRNSPVGAWRPSGVSGAQASALQSLAWEFISQREKAPVQNLSQCAALMRNSFCATYGNYMQVPGQIASCQRDFSASSTSQPFYYNTSTDRDHWFKAP